MSIVCGVLVGGGRYSDAKIDEDIDDNVVCIRCYAFFNTGIL